ncbi:hypothetical protein GC177_07975 [bacterium]|nr:hypothetical protein [bacterium]
MSYVDVSANGADEAFHALSALFVDIQNIKALGIKDAEFHRALSRLEYEVRDEYLSGYKDRHHNSRNVKVQTSDGADHVFALPKISECDFELTDTELDIIARDIGGIAAAAVSAAASGNLAVNNKSPDLAKLLKDCLDQHEALKTQLVSRY